MKDPVFFCFLVEAQFLVMGHLLLLMYFPTNMLNYKKVNGRYRMRNYSLKQNIVLNKLLFVY